MLGPLTAGKKAAGLGYKVSGVPGAAVAGTDGAVGVAVAKRGVKAVVETDAGAEVQPATDEGIEIEVVEEDDVDDHGSVAPAGR